MGRPMDGSIVGSAVIDLFNRNGFYIQRGLFGSEDVEAARNWLKEQDPEQLSKSWTEKEPGVPLAVFSVIHSGDHPIAKIANDQRMLDIAGGLMGEEVYIWSSKVNLKAAWCGSAEYYHQDFVYWKDRGYPRDDMMSCMVFLEPHSLSNAALHVLPGTHKLGYVEHTPFVNINGLAKFMVPPETLSELHAEHGIEVITADPGDVLFFHTSLIHGSSHNISPQSRMILLSQLNIVGNEPDGVSENAKAFNLRRAGFEVQEAKRRHEWFAAKYESQLSSDDVVFGAPIPEEETRS